MPQKASRSARLPRERKLLVAVAVLAVTYCLGAPVAVSIFGLLGY